MPKNKTGQIGERIAERFLVSRGYRIIARNFRYRGGEIDLIAATPAELVFVEVKTRTNLNFGELEETVTPLKLSRLIKTALYFLNSARVNEARSWRLDLIAVKLSATGKLTKIIHLKNISDGI